MGITVHRLPIQRRGDANPARGEATERSASRWSNRRVYAICFDLDTAEAERLHPTNSETGAYKLIERVFEGHGFKRRQGSVYFGDDDTTAVQCVLAVQELVKRHPWIRFAVRDIRMLRVEETNDLMPALGRQPGLFDTASGM